MTRSSRPGRTSQPWSGRLAANRAAVNPTWFAGIGVEADDEGASGLLAGAVVVAFGLAGDVHDIPWTEHEAFPVALQREVAGEDVAHLYAGVELREERLVLLAGKELGQAGTEATFGNEDTEALGYVVRLGRTHGKAYAVFSSLDAEDAGVSAVEEIRKILPEDKGQAGEVAKRGDDATGFKLGEKAGGEASLLAQFDEAHGAFETEALDALAEAGLGEKFLSGFGVYRGTVCVVADAAGEFVGGLFSL